VLKARCGLAGTVGRGGAGAAGESNVRDARTFGAVACGRRTLDLRGMEANSSFKQAFES